MKTQTFETSKGTILVVNLPEGHTIQPFSDPRKEGCFRHLDENGEDVYYEVPPGDWQPLGLLKYITEEQAKEVVTSPSLGLYIDYTSSIRHWFSTALESLTSLLETEINLRNPLGKKPIRSIPFMGAGHYTQNDLDAIDQYKDYLKKWHLSESQVWKNPFLIFKTK